MLASDTRCVAHHGITDSGRGIFAGILTAGAILAATRNAKKAYDLAKKEYDMGKKYYDISKWWLNYYTENFAGPEEEELEEARSLPIEEPNYETARGRARAIAWLASKGYLSKATKCLSRYCTGLRQDMLLEFAAAQADAVSMADGLGYRNERAYVESRNDVRFDRMLQTAKRGRDMMADNVSLAKTSAGIYGSLWNQAWAGLEGAGYYLGYAGNRNAPIMPDVMLGNQGRGVFDSNPQQIAAEGISLLRGDIE